MKKTNTVSHWGLKIMRLSVLYLCVITVFTNLSFATDATGQDLLNRRISIQASEINIKSILSKIESSAEVKFSYSPNLIRASRKITFNAVNEKLSTVLEKLLTPYSIGYEVVGSQIILKRNNLEQPQKTSQLIETITEEQTVLSVSGKVTDENGSPMAGVSISLKNTNRGTSSSADGTYSLTVPDASSVLVFRFVGYVSQETTVGSRSIINVSLAPDNQALTEVVVVGYGTQKKTNLTESVGIVDVKDAQKIQAGSAVDQIQGRVAGVTVASTGGQPGATASIKIRGSGTFDTNQDPIYVIDGVIIGSAGSDFNPSDIETITILKDAAATALYGSRGMNGAVVITTKRGKSGKVKIEYSGYYGIQSIPKRLPLARRDDYIRLWTASYRNGNLPIPNFGVGNYDTDWQEELFKTGPMTDQNISMSGGSENSNYRISLGYFDQDGTIVGPNFKRYSARINAGLTRGKLNIGESFYFAYIDQRRVNGRPFVDVLRMPPTVPVYDPNNLSGFGYGNDNNATFGTNPIGLQLKDDNTGQGYKFLGNIYGEYQITDWLSYRLSVGLDSYNFQDKYFARPGALSFNSPSPTTGILDDRTGRVFNLLIENTVNLNKKFGKHEVRGLLGYTTQRDDYNFLLAHIEGITGDFYQQNSGTLSPRTEGYSEITGLVSYLGRVNYSYDGKYNVQANIRRDASSRFPKANRVAYFPSVSAGWNISQENFMKDQTAIGELRLRASFGSVGNQAITAYSLDPTIQPNLNYVLNGNTVVSGAANRQLQNENLRWESKTTTDIGVDASFYKGKLQLIADYFYSDSRDLLLRVPLPISAGNQGGNPFDNLGRIVNKGFEMSLTYQNKVKDWKYNISGQFSTIRNEVRALVPANGNQPLYGYGQITKTEVGGPLAAFYVLRTNGIFQSQSEIDASAQKGTNATPGDVRFVDVNGDGKINFDDREVIGTPFPTFEYGLNASVSYKNFDLTMFFQGVAGNLLFNTGRNTTDRFDDVQNVRTDITFWTGSGTSNVTPKPIKNDPTLNPTFQSDRWVESGAYGRLRNVQLAYNFPKSFLDKAKMSSLRIYVNAQNLFTITKYSGYDPDYVGDNSNFISRGIDAGSYPVSRVISTGLQLSF
jgi:TonB-dependent starch-binding outer membrane protein SusC